VQALGSEQSNSSMRCGDAAIVKLYRRLEHGSHPEVEMSRYLTRSNFRNTPRLLGVGEVRDTDGRSAVCGVVLELVPGSKDAWELAVDRATSYIDTPGDADPTNPFEREARELGRVVGEMHRALAAGSEEPEFTPSTA